MTDMAQSMHVVFAPPSHGMWELETTHHGVRPLSPFLRDAYKRAFEDGTRVLVERWGLPLAGVRAELVNGCMYVRPTGVGEGAKPQPTPPKVVMKLLTRLHPEMRRRNRTAALAWKERGWRLEVDQWFDRDRAGVIAQNLAFQAVDGSTLDNGQLASHVTDLLVHFETQARKNLENHGGDLIPVGDLVAHCVEWGIDPWDAALLLRGSSPATVETAGVLSPVADALHQCHTTPTSLEDVRQLSPETRAAVDSWVELHAWRLVTSDDIDRPALAEMPALQLAALLAAGNHDPVDVPAPDASAMRARVPEEKRALFDELLTEARYGNRQREDIRGIRWNWPGGLLRRALLEAGRRLVADGALIDAEHVAELSPDELTTLLVQRRGPSADQIADRAATRSRIEATPPPRMLGKPEAPPPLDVLPPAMRRATAALMANLVADTTPPESEVLHGVGIGSHTYRGRARVVSGAADALEKLEPGDILVASFIGPSFNSILPVLGALVVEEGGALCHAAIVAREFGLPAVIGARGATIHILDGAMVEVDASTGIVQVTDDPQP
jgi:phosphohistidine swiveling domain-containing protein